METFEHQTGRTGGLTLALYMKDETERDIVKMLVVLRRTKRYLSLFAVYIIQRAPIDWENIGMLRIQYYIITLFIYIHAGGVINYFDLSS